MEVRSHDESRVYVETRFCRSLPTSGENYVRLNMKLKKYRCRGLVGRTEGAYKRMAWKQRMKGRGEGGTNKCFKCGEEGHWAKNCKGEGVKGWERGVDWWQRVEREPRVQPDDSC